MLNKPKFQSSARSTDVKLPFDAKLNTLNQPVNGYEYLLGQVINGILSNPNTIIKNSVVDEAINLTTLLIVKNDERYETN
jgi:hypothetical protein